jgi:hypothetical protein
MAAPLMGLEDVPTTGAQTWPRENPVTYGSGPFDRHEAVTRKVVPPALKPRFKFSSAARAYLPYPAAGYRIPPSDADDDDKQAPPSHPPDKRSCRLSLLSPAHKASRNRGIRPMHMFDGLLLE